MHQTCIAASALVHATLTCIYGSVNAPLGSKWSVMCEMVWLEIEVIFFSCRFDGPRQQAACQTDSRTPAYSTKPFTSQRSWDIRADAITARPRTDWVHRPSSPSGWTSTVSSAQMFCLNVLQRNNYGVSSHHKWMWSSSVHLLRNIWVHIKISNSWQIWAIIRSFFL